jgi:pimeloyl-ACP methyl ester carboxylesterase
MSLVSHAFNAVVAAMILAPFSLADGSSTVSNNPAPPTNLSRFEIRPGQVIQPLKMRHEYERGKVPVVLIHGLWGLPHQWDRMVQCLEAEPDLRERYQFWMFAYESGDSIPFSAHLLRQSLRQARLLFDPNGTDKAFDRMVVVGHSLGGILAKMMGQSSGLRLWQTVSDLPADKIAGPQKDRLLLRQVYCYERVPEVRRVVCIATPHRGTPLAGGLVRDLGTRLCDRGSQFSEARLMIIGRNDPRTFVAAFRRENPTSLGELAEGHPLLAALCDLGIDPSVRCHSIIAELHDPPKAGATDGIVPYSSSHLECAESELLFHGGHICLSNPAVIDEVRRVLKEHAGTGAASRTDRGGVARNGLDLAPKQ